MPGQPPIRYPSPELREKVLAHIRRYIIADQAEDITAATARPLPSKVRRPRPHRPGATIAPFSLTSRSPVEAARKAEIIAELEAAGAKPASEEDARIVRIENGKPHYGEDIRDTSLIQETQQLHAVSFSKGCDIGQEYRGTGCAPRDT